MRRIPMPSEKAVVELRIHSLPTTPLIEVGWKTLLNNPSKMAVANSAIVVWIASSPHDCNPRITLRGKE
jgi:hypothetical protein